MRFSYEALRHRTLTTPPYRGSQNRFPLESRTSNRKVFLVRQEDGVDVYDIVYGLRWDRVEITKEQYDALQGVDCHKYPIYDDKGKPIPDMFEYHQYHKRFNVLGTVRPDNTFEFNKEYYHQGERTVLSGWARGVFSNDSRRGGMVYNNYHTKEFHPIWKGMRVHCETMLPTTPYEIFIYHVDRKKSKDVIAKYAHFFKVSEVMLKNMNVKTLFEVTKDVVQQTFDKDITTTYDINKKQCVEAAEKLIDDAPLDAFALYALAYEVGRINYRIRWTEISREEMSAHDEFYTQLKRTMSKEIYRDNPTVFKQVKCESGRRIPATDWGALVYVDGKQVEQYA